MKKVIIHLIFDFIFLLMWIVLIFCYSPIYLFILLILAQIFMYRDPAMTQYYICRYPLNDYSEYKVTLKELFAVNEIYLEKDKNIYTCKVGDKKIKFDLKYFIWPVSFVRAYLIRQFLFKYFEKNKIPPENIEKNFLATNKSYNLCLIYENKTYFLIKNGKTKQHFLAKLINGMKYFRIRHYAQKYNDAYYRIDERNYVNSKK